MGRIEVSGEGLGWKDGVVGKNNIIGVVRAEAMPFLLRSTIEYKVKRTGD